MKTTSARPDPVAFAKTALDPATLPDVEDAMRQIMAHPAKPKSKSENREPTVDELNQRWKLRRV